MARTERAAATHAAATMAIAAAILGEKRGTRIEITAG